MMRLGCSGQMMLRPGLYSYGRGRRPPHLSVAVIQLRAVFDHLHRHGILMYRLPCELIPHLPDQSLLDQQLSECSEELAAVGRLAATLGIRLSFHAPATAALGSSEPEVVDQAIRQLALFADLLDLLGQGPEAVVVVHTGGVGGGPDALVDRWIRCWERLPPTVRRRLVLEHDTAASLGVTARIHAATGVPLVFDHLHWLLHNPEGYDLRSALALALDTWPLTTRPKLHFATPRTELRAVRRPGPRNQPRWLLAPPRPGHHSDFVHPWEFARLLETAVGLRSFDVLLEAKAGDLAVARLLADLERYVPWAIDWLQETA